MRDWAVWDTVSVQQCWARTGKKPIGGKWVDVNKGGAAHPDVRSRYVAKELATYKADLLFHSSTPPLEAMRLLMSHTASGRSHGKGGKKMMLLDARKAHLHALATREIYVDLPPELGQGGKCALLRRCLYGTRDAPARWEAHAAAELKTFGFIRGISNACCFCHGSRDLLCVLHGDDFLFSGSAKDLQWIKSLMENRFLIKMLGLLGGDDGDDRELRALNRVISWDAHGISYQADPRHCAILARDMGIKPAGRLPPTPGAKAQPGEDEADEPLDDRMKHLYCSWSARANYLALDRIDLAYASKELCRHFSNPRRSHLKGLLRLATYLQGARWLSYRYDWQPMDLPLQSFSDTDYAGCKKTRRSTSGGVVLRGSHLLKHWSSTQKFVTLSSAEAELGGIVRCATESIGIQSLAIDLGIRVEILLFADAAAAIGICQRTGVGRVRHLATGQLWVQEKLRAGSLRLYKVDGAKNPADLLTKHLPTDTATKLLDLLPVTWMESRTKSAPLITQGGSES